MIFSHQTDVDQSTAKQHIAAMHHQTHTASHCDIDRPDVHTVQDGIYLPCQDQSHPDTQAPSSSAIPWHSDDELSPRASKYFTDLFALYTPREPVGSAPTGDCHATSHSADARKASTITVFPSFVTYDVKPKDADVSQRRSKQHETAPTESQSFFKKHYQRAKEIYRNGPPGEAQMFWAGIKSYLKEREGEVVFEMCSPKQAGEAIREPPQESVAPCQVVDSSLRQSCITVHGTTGDVDKPKTRQDSVVSYSDVSRSSREVPIKLQQTVSTVDANKALPPCPPLSAAPKQHPQKRKGKVLDVNKPLPRTPFPDFSDTPKPSHGLEDDSPVDPHWPTIYTPTVGLEPAVYQPETPRQSIEECSEHIGPEIKQTAWLKNLTKKRSNVRLHADGISKSCKAGKVHNTLKAKISRPILIPLAVQLSPVLLNPYSCTVSEKAMGRQKIPSSPAWLNKLAHPTMPTMPTMPILHKPKKRPDSDASFACQGVREQFECDSTGLGLQDGGSRAKVGGDRESMLSPEPLFTGRGSDGSYHDGSDEQADWKRTGRWV